MAAFLWAINELITGKWPLGQISVLYVSPLKALNNDIGRNLMRPLSELRALFTRSGNTGLLSESPKEAATHHSPSAAACCANPRKF